MHEADRILKRGNEINQMMKVVGEEGTSLDDYVIYQKGELLDSAYLQQNSFDPVDASVTVERQKETFEVMYSILKADYELKDKKEARGFFNEVRQAFLDWNGTAETDERYKTRKEELENLFQSKVRR